MIVTISRERFMIHVATGFGAPRESFIILRTSTKDNHSFYIS